MTQDDIRALVARLDPDAQVTFAGDGHARVVASASLDRDGLAELLRAAPDAQVALGLESPLLLDALDGMLRNAPPIEPCYELDDLEEDGTWRYGRKPQGWGTLP